MTEHVSNLQYALKVVEHYVRVIGYELEDLDHEGLEATVEQETQYAMAGAAVDAIKAVLAGVDAFPNATLQQLPEEVFSDTKWGQEPDVYHVDRGAVGWMMELHSDPDALAAAFLDGRATIHLHIELPANTMTMEIRSEDPELRMEPYARFRNGGLSEGYDRIESGIRVVRFDAA